MVPQSETSNPNTDEGEKWSGAVLLDPEFGTWTKREKPLTRAKMAKIKIKIN